MAAEDAERFLRLADTHFQALKLLHSAADAAKMLPETSGWRCTLIFYIACAYVQALAAARGKELTSHEETKEWLRYTTPDVAPLAKLYKILFDRSREARYEGQEFNGTELQKLLSDYFVPLRERVLKLLEGEGVDCKSASIDPSQWV